MLQWSGHFAESGATLSLASHTEEDGQLTRITSSYNQCCDATSWGGTGTSGGTRFWAQSLEYTETDSEGQQLTRLGSWEISGGEVNTVKNGACPLRSALILLAEHGSRAPVSEFEVTVVVSSLQDSVLPSCTDLQRLDRWDLRKTENPVRMNGQVKGDLTSFRRREVRGDSMTHRQDISSCCLALQTRLMDQNPTHLFAYFLWLLSRYNGRVR